MNRRGRPRKFNLQSDSKRFLDLYLNPLLSPNEISHLAGIKKSTFYNYEKELDLPQLRVGFGTLAGGLPRHLAINSVEDPEERHELNFIKKIAKELQVRIDIVPFLPQESTHMDRAIENKSVDFLISSLTKTKERAKTLYFSDEYFFDGSPHGVLIGESEFISFDKKWIGKPRLGVLTSSVHAEFAESNLKQEFQVRQFRTGREAFTSLRHRTIDFVLFHPSWLNFYPEETQGFKICSAPYFYNTHSAILFHSDSQIWQEPVNQVIDIFHTEARRSQNK